MCNDSNNDETEFSVGAREYYMRNIFGLDRNHYDVPLQRACFSYTTNNRVLRPKFCNSDFWSEGQPKLRFSNLNTVVGNISLTLLFLTVSIWQDIKQCSPLFTNIRNTSEFRSHIFTNWKPRGNNQSWPKLLFN